MDKVRPTWRERLQAGLRILAFVLALGASIVLINVVWDAIGLPHALQHGEVQPLPLLGLAAAVACATAIVTAISLRLLERAHLGAVGLGFSRRALPDLLKGTLLGATPVALVMMLAVGAGYGVLAPTTPDAATLLAATAPGLAATFLLSASEEIVWRGYVLRQLTLATNPIFAVLVTGALFGVVHAANPDATWQGVLFTATGGMLMGWLMIRTGSLWLLIGYHFGWNATSSTLLGLDVSGLGSSASFFVSTLTGPEWRTGGAYGFEGSLPAVGFETLVLCLAIAVARRRHDPTQA
ncbi:MAG: type II CAAX endopeptidase family protein [Hyphomonadaceae bacterium]